MDLSREERMQQRLRGAQRRQVKDVDFGLEIPAVEAVAPLEVAQPMLQSESTPQTLNRRAPANLIPPPPITLFEETPKASSSQSANDANISAKRRKLDSDLPSLLSGRSTRSSQVIAGLHALEENEKPSHATGGSSSAHIEQNSEFVEHEVILQNLHQETANASLVSMQVTEEDFGGSNNAPGSDEGTQVSFDHNSDSERNANEDVISIEPAELEVPIKRRQRITPRPGSEVNKTESERRRSKPARNSEIDFDELSPEQPMRKRKMNQEALDNIDELSPEQPAHRFRTHRLPQVATLNPEKGHPPVEPSGDEAEAIDDEEAATRLKNNRSARRSINPPTASSTLYEHESEHLELAVKRAKRRKEQSSVTQQRLPKKPKSKPFGTSKQPKSKSAPRTASPIPVTVHRLTKALVYNDDDSDADVLNAPIPHLKRDGVNPVDVLSQICYEIIGAALQTLEDGADSCENPTLRREYRTKSQAVECFGDEIQMRLLNHTINVDNAYSLERRLRDEQKKKIALREEILQIRAEREKVALRMDEIRIRHEHETIHARARDSLNTTIHDIELAIDLGNSKIPDDKADSPNNIPGIEMQLKRVAGEATNAGDSGGILKQIKEFNAFLERTALILESKRG